ncbi:DUF2917 domain-containing protein [Chitinimonas sp. BJYL2]|uniref:DUF2917 domain-containing protein n=1 Tax=Chitinimonas sp. BJYL2 TaxID=2976696 RepID=UPI0022B5D5C1|nr:DUF2917 domain-containing protein [Chitinimonas sp. BJYL2]
MTILHDFIEYEQELAWHHLRSVNADLGDRIHCHEGQLWITDAAGNDVLLSAGQSHRISHRGRVVIEALSAARLQLLPRRTARLTMSSMRCLLQQARRVIHRPGQQLIAWWRRRSHHRGNAAPASAICPH